MDAFGIGAAIIGAAKVCMHAARGTGRTTAMIESLKNGDRIVCHSNREGRRLEALLREFNLQVLVIVVDPTNTDDLIALKILRTSEGRTVLDHTWVELYYQHRLQQIARDVDKLQRETSGPSAAHIETRIAAREIAKWGPLAHD